MKNFMGCTNMLIGPNLRYSLTYEADHKGFTIFKRKLRHDFSAQVL